MEVKRICWKTTWFFFSIIYPIQLFLEPLGFPYLSRSGRQSALDPSHPDYLEIESVTSGQPSRFASPHSVGHPTGRLTAGGEVKDGGEKTGLEPLMPAVLKPMKERDALLSKAQERGDRLASNAIFTRMFVLNQN